MPIFIQTLGVASQIPHLGDDNTWIIDNLKSAVKPASCTRGIRDKTIVCTCFSEEYLGEDQLNMLIMV